ncbi:MAG: aminopeptidase P family protein [Bacillaceae bacterium]|nr:aminopeptidase P family protein [Bacillaceae bacterium]
MAQLDTEQQDLYVLRRAKLKEKMEESGIDGVILLSPANIFYFTGFLSDPHERLLALFMSRHESDFMIVPFLEKQEAEEKASVDRILYYRDHEDPYELWKKEGVGGFDRYRTIGLEKGVVSLDRYEGLESLFQEAAFVDMTDVTYGIRMKKDDLEKQKIKASIEMMEKALAIAVRKVKPGVKEMELAAEIDYQMRLLGAEAPAFDTIVLTGTRTALPHGKPGMAELRPGDFLLIDMGAFAGGYASDITRTFVVGDEDVVDSRMRTIYQTVLEAQLKAIEAIKPGAAIGEIDRVARQHIEAAGFGDNFIHRVGHGMGIEVHEPPSMHQENQDRIEPGMVFTVEPGIYIPDIGGVRIEDDVIVTEQGVEVLTSYPKQWTVL